MNQSKTTIGILYDGEMFSDARFKMFLDLSLDHLVIIFTGASLDTHYIEEAYPSITIVRLSFWSLYPFVGSKIVRKLSVTFIKLFSLATVRDSIIQCDVLLSSEVYSWYSYSFFSQAKKIKPTIKCVPVVYETINNHLTNYILPYGWCLRKVRKIADSYWAFTERSRDYLLNLDVPKEKIFTIYQGIVIPEEIKRIPKSQADSLKILFCGRLVFEKGIMEIISVFTELAKKYPKIELHICGDGPLRTAIEQYKNPHIFLHGFVSPDQIGTYYRAADIFCLYSKDLYKLGVFHFWEEQLGNVLIEAMAYSLPLVVSRNGAIPEVVGEHNFLFSNMSELSEMLEKAIVDETKRLDVGEKNYNRACAHFNLYRNTQALSKHLDEIALQ